MRQWTYSARCNACCASSFACCTWWCNLGATSSSSSSRSTPFLHYSCRKLNINSVAIGNNASVDRFARCTWWCNFGATSCNLGATSSSSTSFAPFLHPIIYSCSKSNSNPIAGTNASVDVVCCEKPKAVHQPRCFLSAPVPTPHAHLECTH